MSQGNITFIFQQLWEQDNWDKAIIVFTVCSFSLSVSPVSKKQTKKTNKKTKTKLRR